MFENIIDDAKQHAEDEFPKESVGIVVDNKYIPIENYHPTPETDWHVADKSFSKYYIEDKIQCLIHSHNDDRHASKMDQEKQREFDIPFGIVNVRDKKALHIFFWGDPYPTTPLYGRDFHFGVYDCLTFVRDYYQQELGVALPNPVREWDFWSKGVEMFEQYVCEFDKIEVTDLQKNDLILYKCNGRMYDHLGVYLGDERVGHHFADCISAEYEMGHKRNNLSLCLRKV